MLCRMLIRSNRSTSNNSASQLPTTGAARGRSHPPRSDNKAVTSSLCALSLKHSKKRYGKLAMTAIFRRSSALRDVTIPHRAFYSSASYSGTPTTSPPPFRTSGQQHLLGRPLRGLHHACCSSARGRVGSAPLLLQVKSSRLTAPLVHDSG